ncbi:ABC transporter ATP-binding protein [Aeromicrobium sp. A1-2]|uniref:ABC transporter ATP-binding protein n=1 Tax=Aeromicrobium sp. A1-2 TaxID=2107713 RepID=UPI000E4DF9A5|nr:ABC transporter ATP-binding protein [Aeromicrobium sp. A1-2]AXT85026.1 ABC transporter ATP-binding protein [Aeromicrobium sp. A1-2]
MIELSDVTLTFPDGDRRVTAVDHASLTVEPGTITAITGPSGSGKSSLLAVASTLISPDSGSVRIDGIDVTAMNRKETAELRRSTIGIVFQQSNLLPSLTALDQLLVMKELGQGHGDRSETATRAEALLESMGLGHDLGKRPHQLSGGERQRVNIARALMNEPSALIVDEPTSALDQERGAEIIDLILKLTVERGTATLLVTHDQSHLLRMDAVHIMIDGRLSIQPRTGQEFR